MNEGRDTHYQPWLRDEDSAKGRAADPYAQAPRADAPAEPVEDAAIAPPQSPQVPPARKPPVGLDLNRYSHAPNASDTGAHAAADPYRPHEVAPLPTTSGGEESWGSLAAKSSKKLAASVKRGWTGFANWTIYLGEKADIPARIAAMHLDEKAKAAAEAVAEASKVAANKTAEASKVAANKTAEFSKIAANKTAEGAKQLSQKTVEGVAKLELGDKIGDVAEKAGETIKKGASSVVDATKAASESVVDATKSGVETVAKGASDLTRKPSVDAAAIPSALERLLAEEAAAQAPAQVQPSASMTDGQATPATPVPAAPVKAPPPLPLFAEVPETVPAQPSPKKPGGKPSYRSMALERAQGDEAFRSAEIIPDPVDIPDAPRDAADDALPSPSSPSPLAARFDAMRNRLKAKMTERSSAASGTAAPATAAPSKAWIYALVGTLAIGATLWGVSGKIPPQSLRSDTASADAPVLAAAGIERSDRAEIEAIVHDYILNHPEIIPEAMERYQAKQMAKQIDAVRSDLETPFAGAWTGAAKGDVVLVEFADFACGFCRRSVADVERLLREDKNLKVVHRDLPILSEESVVAAKTALAAAKQGKYRDYYLAQFAGGPPSEASIKAAAAKAGLDSAALQKAFLNGDLQAEIEKNLGFARDLGFNGTPTFIIGDRVLQGAVGYDELKKAIAEARAKK